MFEPKPFASLSAGLLARKGDARPAIRRAYVPMAPIVRLPQPETHDDLGWNDMGTDEEPARDAEVLQLTPSPANPATAAQARAIDHEANDQLDAVGPAEPPVRKQQVALAERLTDPEPAAEPRAPRSVARGGGKRAAFTLRLDAQRHLKLRLACTVRGRSAQQIVTEALDALLGDMPELDSLAAQVKRH